MSVSEFRVVVVVCLLLAIAAPISDVAMRAQMPEPLKAYLEAEDEAEAEIGSSLILLAFFAIGVGTLAIISTAGLLLLWRPARLLYTISYVLALPLYFFMGPTISTGVTEFLNHGATFLGGVIWALIYFSPLKQYFDTPAQPLAA